MDYTTILDCKDKHCIIGDDPSGLPQARALLALHLPFDVFERHKDIGGLWDIENPAHPFMNIRILSH